MAAGSTKDGGGKEPEKWKFMNEFWFQVTFICRSCDCGENEEKGDEKAEEKELYLVGDFNQWDQRRHKMEPCPEGYSTTMLLSEGFYHYKFIVEGQWVRDSWNPHIGGEFDNSIMFVHMDPKVYGLREQHPPHRNYHRPHADGGQFCALCPPLRQEISASGILQRLVFVYLPPSYNSEPNRQYPVVYANDGQNLFSTPEEMGGPFRGGWYLDAKLDHFWSQGLLPEFILVGVPNSDFVCIGNRNREYCTSQFQDTAKDAYKRYLIEVVKKEVDSLYRTLTNSENTVILGASMGGLCAFTLALNHPDIFSACVCMSPSFWYVDCENSSAFDLIQKRTQSSPRPLVYIDSGDGAGDNCYETCLMREALLESGWSEGEEFRYVLDECSGRQEVGDVTHSESVWRERVLPALQFALRHEQS